MDTNLTNILGKINTAKFFKGKPNKPTNNSHERLPPGQHLLNDLDDFPVLDLGIQPEYLPEEYKFMVTGLVRNPLKLTLPELEAKFPKSYLTADFHCVTKWSKFDVKWTGIKYLDLEKYIQPLAEAKFVIQMGLDNYYTNVSLLDLRKANVILAYEHEGHPLEKEHGAPLRMIIPDLYAWKGSKFLTRLHFQNKDNPGFWEERGYHNHGDPWQEERYS
jgi:DMSO/TMAO reductase YedYZ molybdopterin-dependent catalytic subunit